MLKEQPLLLKNLILVLIAAFFGGMIFKRLRQPIILGYILVGLLLSVFFGKSLSDSLSSLAEIGIALLMFTLGLEFSFSRVKEQIKKGFLGGLIQILITILIFFGLLLYFGFNFYTSLFLASCFSLSSTAIVVKILSDRGEIETLPGSLSVAWLLLQDLAVLPMIVILPAIGYQVAIEASFLTLFLKICWAILKAGVFLFFVFFLSKKMLPFILRKIAQLNSQELLLSGALTACLIFAWTSFYLGLSFALGAFLAGFLIGQTEEEIAIFSQIRPLRDLFSIIFFVSLGFLVNLNLVFENFILILGTSFLVVFIKFFVVFLVALFLGFHPKVAFISGSYLLQVGEFSFVLALAGARLGLLNPSVQSIIFGVATLTMIFSPLAINYAPFAFRFLFKRLKRLPQTAGFLSRLKADEYKEELSLSNHVVLIGYGRVGRYIGRGLEMSKTPYLVVDYNHQLIKQLKNKGTEAVYGDPSQIEVLDYAQVDKAKAVVVAIPDRESQKMIVAHCLTLNPKIKIISRTHFEKDQKMLKALGATNIIQPEFEAALSILHRLYHFFGVSFLEIPGKIKRLKIEHGLG